MSIFFQGFLRDERGQKKEPLKNADSMKNQQLLRD
jgi:hypothetical protein